MWELSRSPLGESVFNAWFFQSEAKEQAFGLTPTFSLSGARGERLRSPAAKYAGDMENTMNRLKSILTQIKTTISGRVQRLVSEIYPLLINSSAFFKEILFPSWIRGIILLQPIHLKPRVNFFSKVKRSKFDIGVLQLGQ